MVGQTGVGRSHLAEALGTATALRGCNVLFITQTELLKKLHAAPATEFYERKLQQLLRVPVPTANDSAT
ncbi:ATP-binding protein [Paraburkholderia caledonica]|uniref:DNA replication protein DnaC n=1 Tax=Paraburkholderia caledonica TaxID=134536 RepID=A0AB73IVC2_9BURK|nr:DNA replication protein DnaC [Paraburkholderia caledonica]